MSTNETPSQAIGAVEADIQGDVAATKADATNLLAQAQSEYSQLSEGAKGRFHQLLNDLETAEGVVLASLHTVFGAK